MNIIRKAAQFASQAHLGQKRKYTGVDYFHHLAIVAGRVATWSGHDAHVAIAYLHDTVEDVKWVTLETIRKGFGGYIAEGVEGLTSRSSLTGHKGNRAERKKFDLEYLTRQPEHIRRIKLEDRRHNLEDFLRDVPARDSFCELYARESHELVKALGEVADGLERAHVIHLATELLKKHGEV